VSITKVIFIRILERRLDIITTKVTENYKNNKLKERDIKILNISENTAKALC